ncbi:MAG: molecular chaperone HtpG [Nitratireductor sp.]
MTDTSSAPVEHHAFEADVARLLTLMVHSVYSERDVFLRELISNAADACEKLRYEAIAEPALLGDDPQARITLAADHEGGTLSVADNGIGMSRDDLAESLGTIARSGTKAFLERVTAQGGDKGLDGDRLIGQFGIGFYSAFMVADRVEVFSRRAGSDEAWRWSSDGSGSYEIAPAALEDAPARGTRVVLTLKDDAKSFAERAKLERIVKAQSGHVPVPILIVEKPGAEPEAMTDGSALWAKPKAEITPEDYADFYRGLSGQYDEPALTVHFRAEGRHEYSALAFVPGARPFDLFDPDRKGRVKLYVKRVFITDDAELLPRYLRFVRGLVDTADLPLNVSREMIQESPILAAIRKGLTNRVLTGLEKLSESEPDTFDAVWRDFGGVLKEGIYEDFERQEQLLGLARFRTTETGAEWRTLKDYVAAMKDNTQQAIYFLAGDDLERLRTSPQLEGFRARGLEVLLLSDPVDSFWAATAQGFQGKPFRSVTQGAADRADIPRHDADTAHDAAPEADAATATLIAFAKTVLEEAVSDVRASERLTESAVCLVAPEGGPDRQLERILKGAGQAGEAAKPVLEINPRHALVKALAAVSADTTLREDAVRLLYDEALILDGERVGDARGFSERLARVLQQALGSA